LPYRPIATDGITPLTEPGMVKARVEVPGVVGFDRYPVCPATQTGRCCFTLRWLGLVPEESYKVESEGESRPSLPSRRWRGPPRGSHCPCTSGRGRTADCLILFYGASISFRMRPIDPLGCAAPRRAARVGATSLMATANKYVPGLMPHPRKISGTCTLYS
jgi:hypothetical protein